MSERARRPFRLPDEARPAEQDVDAEIEFHLALRTSKLVAGGMAPDTARAEAERQFGDVRALRAECLTIDRERERATKRANRLDDLRQDIAYAFRTLAHHKGFTIVVILILGLGIGANTALFTLIDALLLRTLPVPHPERLVTIGDPRRTNSLSTGSPRTDLASYPLYADLRKANHVLTGLYANGRTNRLDALIHGAAAGGSAAPAEVEHPRGRLVSGNFFSVLQVRAVAGRTFTADEDRVPGGDPVVVISYAYWQRRFGGSRKTIGGSLTLNGVPFTIIGVTPPGFTGDIVGRPTEMWIPLMMQPSLMPHRLWLTDRHISWLLLMGRLAPGVTVAQARVALGALETHSLTANATAAELATIRRQLRELPVRVESGARGFSYYRSAYAAALLTLMAAVALVLLVVCANVANLMLARAATRGRELSVRMALGAGRWRLLRQLLTESTLLALAGGALGFLFAVWGSAALLRLAGGGPNPIPLALHVDGRILGFTALVALLTVLLFGLAPGLKATKVDLAAALRTQGRNLAGATSGRGGLAARKALIVAQVALSTLLLVGSAILLRSAQRLEHADTGVARDRLLIGSVDAQRAGYGGARLTALMRDLMDRVRQVPGVAQVSLSENGLFSGTESGTSLQVQGFTAHAEGDTLVAYDDVGPHYFDAVGAHLLQGRDFEPRDNEMGPKVAVVNATMARFFFPHGDAVGHYVTLDSATYQIVGIVADIQEQDVREAPERRLYLPTLQIPQPPGAFYMEIRAVGDPARLAVPLRRALRAVDPSLVVGTPDPLTDLIRDSISQDRLVATVVTVFGVITLVLAALGLYGVMAYATVQRTNEFGLRIALGAHPARLAGMVLRETLLLTAAGVLIGLPLALAATRALHRQLFELGPFDLPSFALAVVVLGASAALAGQLPARRASRVTPLEALRDE